MLVIAMAVGVTMYMVVYLIPKLELYLQSLGKDIPPMTQYLLNGSIWLRENYLPLTGVLLGLLLIPVILYATRDGRLWIDRFALYVPLVGSLMRLADTAAFSRSLSLLLANGVTLIEALNIVENLVYNRFSATIVTDARAKIIQGSNFANALDHRRAFTPMLKQMVAIGEQSGNLESVLSETAAFHEQQFLAIMRRLNALLTPVLTILIGVVVGYVYIAFFVALFAAAG
jgi:type IV pilus assembly protein PilC